MDIQVQELIDKIKKDGIESASEEAAHIKHDAENEASRIVEAAKKEAADIVAKAKQDAERSEKAGIAAIEQASRNLVLLFRGEIQGLLDKVIDAELVEAYNDDTVKKILPEVLKSWSEKGIDSLSLLLPEASISKIESYFTTKLANELKKGMEIKPDSNINAGFRIAMRDGSAYYDFSAEAVAELFSAYLNPYLSEIFKSSTKEL